jgi:hypothetical protein
MRKRHRYAAILIDAETRERMDVLPGRGANALADRCHRRPLPRPSQAPPGRGASRRGPAPVHHPGPGRGRPAADLSAPLARLMLTRPGNLSDSQRELYRELIAACPEMTETAGLCTASLRSLLRARTTPSALTNGLPLSGRPICPTARLHPRPRPGQISCARGRDPVRQSRCSLTVPRLTTSKSDVDGLVTEVLC